MSDPYLVGVALPRSPVLFVEQDEYVLDSSWMLGKESNHQEKSQKRGEPGNPERIDDAGADQSHDLLSSLSSGRARRRAQDDWRDDILIATAPNVTWGRLTSVLLTAEQAGLFHFGLVVTASTGFAFLPAESRSFLDDPEEERCVPFVVLTDSQRIGVNRAPMRIIGHRASEPEALFRDESAPLEKQAPESASTTLPSTRAERDLSEDPYIRLAWTPGQVDLDALTGALRRANAGRAWCAFPMFGAESGLTWSQVEPVLSNLVRVGSPQGVVLLDHGPTEVKPQGEE